MIGLKQHSAALALSRQMLVARCALQRDSLIADSRELQPMLGVLDAAERGVQFLRRHPVLSLGVGAALLYALRLPAVRTIWHAAQTMLQKFGFVLPMVPMVLPSLLPILRRLT
jgi:hypothetical protein